MAHISRRLRKESEKWIDRDGEIYTLITNESKLKVEVIILKIGRYEQLIFDFIIPFEYPFVPPTVLFKGKSLKSYYFTSRLFRQELRLIDNQKLSTNTQGVLIDNQRLSTDCLCCASILCQNNWGPTLNIINIVKEIKEFFNIKIRLLEKYMVLKVMKNMPQSLSNYVSKFI